jgi:FtsZ-binding cell division protein ZapB
VRDWLVGTPARGWIARLDDQLLEIERLRERIAQLKQDNQGLQQTITQLQQENQRLQQQSAPQQEPC